MEFFVFSVYENDRWVMGCRADGASSTLSGEMDAGMEFLMNTLGSAIRYLNNRAERGD